MKHQKPSLIKRDWPVAEYKTKKKAVITWSDALFIVGVSLFLAACFWLGVIGPVA